MGLGLVGFLFLCGLSSISSEESSDVRVIISGNSTIAQTNEHFVCATLDWWPSDKCDYNQCSWGQSSILNLDLNHPFLAKAIRAFSPLRIRVGGTLQDKVVYGLPNLGFPCLPFSKKADELYGFSEGCLSLSRWDELNLLFEKTGAIAIFGLNALSGRYYIQNEVWGGPWNSSNARDFIEYTISKGYPVDSWEFGNELGGQGIGASVGARQYGKDAVVLRHILDELYKGSSIRPLLVAPGGIFEQEWYGRFLKVSGSRVVDALTHHIYNLGAGNNTRIVSEITDPQYLNQIADTYKSLQRTIKRHGKWVSAWVSEAGGVYNSGSRLFSNKFINSFWYLDQLGMASKYNTKVYCRQTLIGGNYGLLDTETFVPNPDYYSALLWHRLMGKGVLSADIGGSGSSFLRTYAHCRKQKEGVTLILINLSNSTQFNVSVGNDINRTISWVGSKSSDGSEKREEYHLTAKDGNYLSQTMLLNGRPLELTGDEEIPALDPELVAIRSPVFVAPLSIAFVVFPNFEARACL